MKIKYTRKSTGLFLLVTLSACGMSEERLEALRDERTACFEYVRKLGTLPCRPRPSLTVNDCNTLSRVLGTERQIDAYDNRTIEEIDQSTETLRCSSETMFCDRLGFLNLDIGGECIGGV